jgi:acyl-CoA synthetase (AMP-forming)/AMP-acid ligase II
MNLTQAIHRNARDRASECAGRDRGGALNWSELAREVARFAGALRRDGLQPGDRVAMLARNRLEYMVYVFGTFWAGGVINPVNWRWTAAEMAHSLADCDTRFLFVAGEYVGLVDALRETAPCLSQVICLDRHDTPGVRDYREWLAEAGPVDDAMRQGSDLAAILYTGGTTGRARGVMLSHANMLASTYGILIATNEASTPRHLHTPPLFHVGALSNLFLAVTVAASSAFLPAFDPVSLLDAIEQWQISELFLVPTMIGMLVDHPAFATRDVTGVRRLRYGAAAIDEPLLDRAMRSFPNADFVQAYGMTELGPVATVLAPADHRPGPRRAVRLQSAGRATPTCEVRIVGPDGIEVARGTVGEIVARGPNVMLGYWGMPEATHAALHDGWMHTGDLGRMDADGYVTIVDRLKDMIVTGGENVYSAEVENAIAGHPSVSQVTVIGLPDPLWGERVHAVVVCRPDAEPCGDSILAHCRTVLAGYKLPRSVSFVTALPLSGAGKILKNVLREELKHNSPRPDAG